MFLNRVFSSKGRIKILRVLSKHEGDMSISEVSRESDISKAGVSKAINGLIRSGIIKSERRGKMIFLSINTKNSIGNAVAELFLWEKSVENETLPIVMDTILEDYSGNNIVSIVIFGSRARKTAKMESDVDVMCIYKRLEKSKVDSKVVKGFLVTIFSISEAEFIERVRTGDPLLINVVRDAVVKKGVKEFNEIVKRAKEGV